MYDHVHPFARKLVMFCSQLEKFNFTHFPSMSILSPVLTEAYVLAITDLREEFTLCFKDFSTHLSEFDVFAKPLSVYPVDSDAALQLELIELQWNSALQHHNCNNNLLTFYTNLRPVTRYHQLAINAKIMLCLFRSTYLCDTFFSKMKFANNEYRTSFMETNVNNTLRISGSVLFWSAFEGP